MASCVNRAACVREEQERALAAHAGVVQVGVALEVRSAARPTSGTSTCWSPGAVSVAAYAGVVLMVSCSNHSALRRFACNAHDFCKALFFQALIMPRQAWVVCGGCSCRSGADGVVFESLNGSTFTTLCSTLQAAQASEDCCKALRALCRAVVAQTFGVRALASSCRGVQYFSKREGSQEAVQRQTVTRKCLTHSNCLTTFACFTDSVKIKPTMTCKHSVFPGAFNYLR